MSRQPRFEICRGDDGWWARFRAVNGRVVWVTETYDRRRGAERAIQSFVQWFRYPTARTSGGLWWRKNPTNDHDIRVNGIEVREVDERE